LARLGNFLYLGRRKSRGVNYQDTELWLVKLKIAKPDLSGHNLHG